MKPKPRPLSASEISSVVEAGSRWAWQLEAKLAGVYATAILQAYDGAAAALETRSLTAALTPGERKDAQDRTRAATKAANDAASTPNLHSSWSKPNEDEIGDSLRRKYEQKADASSTAIRVEAMRRVTKKGLELMYVNLEAVNPLLKGVISGLGGNIEIADTTRRDVMRSIDESWQAGDSIPRTAAKIRAAGSEISKTRSLLIARTELIGAINAAAHALGTISNEYTPAGGAPLLKIWLTAEDEKVRDTHVAAGDAYGAGSGIPLGAAFQVGDSAMQFPGDQNGAAEEVCNCRCALSYEEGDALTASIGGTMDGEIEFQGKTYRPTGALLASGVPVYELAVDLPDAADGAKPLDELADAIPSEGAIENARAWTSVLCLEGVATCDNRMFGIDAWTWRALPLTIAMQFELQPEHMGALPVGRIDEIEKMPVAAAIAAGLMDDQDGGYNADAVAVVGHGIFDDSGLGDEAMRLIGDQIQRGVSADYAPSAFQVVEMPPIDGQEFGNLMEICTAAELLSATIVSQPAFAGTTIMLDSMTAGVFPEPGSPSAAVTRASIRLARVAPTMTAAAMDFSSHCMIACAPTSEQASAIAQPGGQPAGDLHVTLAYLPKPDGIDFDKLNAVVSKVAADHKTIEGKVGGAGYFAPAPPATPAPDAKAPDAPPAAEPKTAPPAKPVAKKAAAAAPPEPVADPETPADSQGDGPDGTTDPPSGDADPGPLHPHVALVDAPGLSAMRGALCSALDDAGIDYAQNHDFTPHVTLGYEANPGVPAMGVSGAPLSFSHLSVHQGAARRDHPFSDAETPGITASAAGLAPLEPPSDWFEDPELAEPTPLTIDDDGRIYGHLATWGTCHVGIRDACVQPPESALDYALFHLGHIKTADGDLIPVGTFTMDTGHAPLAHADGRPVTMQQALAHYDNTGTAVADVRCGEDDHGIWFAGAIRPDLEATKVRALRAAQISGDWRKHSGRLEFCAGLAVNVPGYPVVRPRTALAASGDPTGLVAAGVDLRVAPLSALDVAAKRLALRERLEPGTLAAERDRALARITA